MRESSSLASRSLLRLSPSSLAATATGARPRRPQIPGCAKASLNLVEEGRLTLATDNPAFEPWWCGGSKQGLGDQRPPHAARVTSRRSRTRIAEAARLHEGAGRLAGGAVPQVVRAREEVVRLLHRAGLEHARAPKGRRLHHVVLLREPGGRGAEGERRSRRSRSLAGLKRYRLGASVGTTSYEYIVTLHQARPVAARLRHRRRRRHGAEDEADRRHRRTTSRAWATSRTSRCRLDGRRAPADQLGPKEHFGLVFQKGNPLVRCVNRAINAMRRTGR